MVLTHGLNVIYLFGGNKLECFSHRVVSAMKQEKHASLLKGGSLGRALSMVKHSLMTLVMMTFITSALSITILSIMGLIATTSITIKLA
jgi:hypothetical protein